MESAYYIVILRQIGNIGPNEITKIGDQPKEGFENEAQAEKHMFELSKSKKYPFDRGWHSYSIMKLYRTK